MSTESAPAAAAVSGGEPVLRVEELAPASDGGGLKKEVLQEGTGELPADGDEVSGAPASAARARACARRAIDRRPPAQRTTLAASSTALSLTRP
jgi:hypothetical protein